MSNFFTEINFDTNFVRYIRENGTSATSIVLLALFCLIDHNKHWLVNNADWSNPDSKK